MSVAVDALSLAVGVATGAATLLGGVLALRFRSVLNLLLAFGGGVILGVALFDLLPEALDLIGQQHSHLSITTAVAVGFGLYLAADRGLAIMAPTGSPRRGHFAPATLTAHSLMDGLGIGLALHISASAGLVLAVAVLAHDILDGANTVALALGAGANPRVARRWLMADAAAPMVGLAIARLITVPPFVLAILLGGLAGFFIYIGGSEILPRSHDRRPQFSTIAISAAGLGFIYTVVWFAPG